ncbi:unnamed protein product [Ceutorhynchus assimilis]|uniref:ditrans,polycis-polyprenyl diphosphate synthase [(2E,6E)-farnesyldiphosphate specific] n=1 Tax=Ceutorhynchus assimilis TaxID=467358 RepID=A0A9N9QQB2_9CUCU|nr:unnamed protein product [Ceutorhynchus assimilis]
MSSGPLYKVLYVLVHSIFTVYEWITDALERIGSVFVDFCHGFFNIQRRNYLKNEIAKKNKIPKHLTVLLGREEPSFQDLANIVLWCLASRIVFLSFYDHRGILKKHQDKLEKEISKKLQHNDHVIWHNIPGSTYKNGFVGRKIHIKLLSQDNGKTSIANLAQRLSKSESEISDISIPFVDHALQKDFEFPDPEMGISCGKYLSFINYPPWQIRVTEFLSIKSHYRFRYRTFLELLYVYGRCEQRLGK